MTRLCLRAGGAGACLAAICMMAGADRTDPADRRAVFGDYRSERPGLFHKITPSDLPKPFSTKSAENGPTVVPRPEGAWPQAPAGFKVELYALGLKLPRLLRTAPNHDVFVAETDKGEIKTFRGITKDSKPDEATVFATGLRQPFGIAFYPPGPSPQWVYIANINSVVRFPYKNGDLKATGPAEYITKEIPNGGGHTTRDVVFSLDGKRMFVAVGSRSNVDDVDTHRGEFHRANILEFTPDGKFVKVYGAGIRNPVGLAIHPQTGELWCSVNERDELGDDLVPDYITHVEEGGFYGWPWFYTGSNQDPRHAGKHPELKDKVLVPDILLQPHHASLEMTFYDGTQFPKEYQGDIFAAQHGSWNRAIRTGYEVIRAPMKNGHATGEYEDFLTGFVTADGKVWGRPVGVTVAPDGSLLVTDDGSKSIWRVSCTGK